MSSRIPETQGQLYVVILLAIITTGGLIDLALDAPRHWHSAHSLFEMAYLVVCLGATVWLGRGWYLARLELLHTRSVLSQREVDRDNWRQQAQVLLEGMGEAIDKQLRSWELTTMERETALLLLKGYSHQAIADLRQCSERTVRQHAVSVYRKSGLGGRAELSAFFLEDILLPPETS